MTRLLGRAYPILDYKFFSQSLRGGTIRRSQEFRSALIIASDTQRVDNFAFNKIIFFTKGSNPWFRLLLRDFTNNSISIKTYEILNTYTRMTSKNNRYHTNIWFKDMVTLVDYLFHTRDDLFIYFGGENGGVNEQGM